MEKLLIGQKVSWCVGSHKMIGVVLEDDVNVKIICHFRGEYPHTQQVEVKRGLLTKID